jgi:hypothetical protein
MGENERPEVKIRGIFSGECVGAEERDDGVDLGVDGEEFDCGICGGNVALDDLWGRSLVRMSD